MYVDIINIVLQLSHTNFLPSLTIRPGSLGMAGLQALRNHMTSLWIRDTVF